MKPRLLDLFCCQGGAARGYADAGFEVEGVDKDPQPRYPFGFTECDALDYLESMLASVGVVPMPFDAVHASPPCQKFTKAQRLRGNEHLDLITPIRPLLEATGLPYVIENVPEARDFLIDPVELDGTMFGIAQYRPRLFETNWPLDAPLRAPRWLPQVKMGRPPKDNEIVQAVGNFSGADRARRDLEVPWMSKVGIKECVPPAYTRYIGERLLAFVESERKAVA